VIFCEINLQSIVDFLLVLGFLIRGVVCIVVVGYIVYHYCLRFDRGVVRVIVVGYIVDHYYLL
jgi:hypothetical protein